MGELEELEEQTTVQKLPKRSMYVVVLIMGELEELEEQTTVQIWMIAGKTIDKM